MKVDFTKSKQQINKEIFALEQDYLVQRITRKYKGYSSNTQEWVARIIWQIHNCTKTSELQKIVDTTFKSYHI